MTSKQDESIGFEEILDSIVDDIAKHAVWFSKNQYSKKPVNYDIGMPKNVAKERLLQAHQTAIKEAEQKRVGDAMEIDVPPETMQYVISQIKLKPKTIADRVMVGEWLVKKWADGTADKYDLKIEVYTLRLLAHLTRRFNWAIFLLKPENLPNSTKKKGANR